MHFRRHTPAWSFELFCGLRNSHVDIYVGSRSTSTWEMPNSLGCFEHDRCRKCDKMRPCSEICWRLPKICLAQIYQSAATRANSRRSIFIVNLTALNVFSACLEPFYYDGSYKCVWQLCWLCGHVSYNSLRFKLECETLCASILYSSVHPQICELTTTHTEIFLLVSYLPI